MENSSAPFPEWDGPCPLEATYFLSEDYARTLLWSDFDVAFVSVAVPLVWGLGLAANGAFLFVLARLESMRTLTNAYLASLAVSDTLLLTAVAVQDSLLMHVLSSGAAFNALPGGDAFCGVYSVSRETFYMVSLLLVTLVNRERYLAVCYPLRHRLVEGRGRAVRLIVGAWLLGGVYGAVASVNFTRLTRYCMEFPRTSEFAGLPRAVGYCYSEIVPQRLAVYTVDLLGAFPFALALPATAYMYLRIYRTLGRRPETAADRPGSARAGGPGRTTTTASAAERTRRDVARMLLANSAVFFACHLPGWLKATLDWAAAVGAGFALSEAAAVGLWQAAVVAALLNAAVNPFIYGAASARYRRAFREAFCPRRAPPAARKAGTGTGNISLSARLTAVSDEPTASASTGNPSFTPLE